MVRVPPTSAASHADPMRLRQVLLNLLSNACKFTKNGAVTLSVARGRIDGHDWLEFAVRDTGIGMTPEQQASSSRSSPRRSLDRPPATAAPASGSPSRRRLCRMMGGDVTVTSEAGQGLDLHRAPAGARASEITIAGCSRAAPGAASGSCDPRHRRRRHRARPDHGAAQDRRASRWRPRPAALEGLKLAKELRPMAITLDVMMPDLDGWSVLAALRAGPGARRHPGDHGDASSTRTGAAWRSAPPDI